MNWIKENIATIAAISTLLASSGIGGPQIIDWIETKGYLKAQEKFEVKKDSLITIISIQDEILDTTQLGYSRALWELEHCQRTIEAGYNPNNLTW